MKDYRRALSFHAYSLADPATTRVGDFMREEIKTGRSIKVVEMSGDLADAVRTYAGVYKTHNRTSGVRQITGTSSDAMAKVWNPLGESARGARLRRARS